LYHLFTDGRSDASVADTCQTTYYHRSSDGLSCFNPIFINSFYFQKTRVGMTINELRKKTTDDRVSKRAKSLIKEWKNLLEKKNSRIDSMVLPRNDSSASNLSDNNINVCSCKDSMNTYMIL